MFTEATVFKIDYCVGCITHFMYDSLPKPPKPETPYFACLLNGFSIPDERTPRTVFRMYEIYIHRYKALGQYHCYRRALAAR